MTDAQRTVIGAVLSSMENAYHEYHNFNRKQFRDIRDALARLLIHGDGLTIEHADDIVQALEDAGLDVDPKELRGLMAALNWHATEPDASRRGLMAEA